MKSPKQSKPVERNAVSAALRSAGVNPSFLPMLLSIASSLL